MPWRYMKARRCGSARSTSPPCAVTTQCELSGNNLLLGVNIWFPGAVEKTDTINGCFCDCCRLFNVLQACSLLSMIPTCCILLPMKEACAEADAKLPACMVLKLRFICRAVVCSLKTCWGKSQDDLSERGKDFLRLSGCFCFCFRKAPQHWQLRTDSALRNVQRSKRENTFASQQMDKTPSYPVWNMPNCLISERKPDGKDACPPFNWWKSKRSSVFLCLTCISLHRENGLELWWFLAHQKLVSVNRIIKEYELLLITVRFIFSTLQCLN